MLPGKKRFFLISTCFMLSSGFANDSLVNSTAYIVNLNASLTSLQSKTDLPLMFPKQVPQTSGLKKLYVSFDPTLVNNNSYWISIDSSKDCQGAHYCNIGSLKVARIGDPQIYYAMNKQALTKTINLSSRQKAYYTPGHAMGDYWPPMLEWRDQKYFYQLIWQVDSANVLIQTAQTVGPLSKIN